MHILTYDGSNSSVVMQYSASSNVCGLPGGESVCGRVLYRWARMHRGSVQIKLLRKRTVRRWREAGRRQAQKKSMRSHVCDSSVKRERGWRSERVCVFSVHQCSLHSRKRKCETKTNEHVYSPDDRRFRDGDFYASAPAIDWPDPSCLLYLYFLK